ncbi:hypothetical protein ASG76_01985 [Nocardioides sp. Soil774]|uniref:hypothetical protein n=1 Tax=Nocardioides sp. Soil774 TaxID=1736408 RepID=UPI0006F7847A|nr:hypothetical protein [Nocardioides sp. Soil774]KRE97509.1 hypothetical protein ASG76_01985 [Nocardioides sp. Soil774]
MSRVVHVLVLACMLSGCSTLASSSSSSPSAGDGATREPTVAATPTDTRSRDPHPASAPPSGDPYVDLARLLHSRGVEVWFEADLVRSWLEGPKAFAETVDRLAVLARVEGVAGFKVADELGYGDGLETSAQVRRFLQAADAALHRVAPGKELLVDVVVPDLGCLPWQGESGRACAAEARAQYPAATMVAVSGYLRSGTIDRLDLSTGLLDPGAYRSRDLTPTEAQQAAWAHVEALGWEDDTVLQSRKALADRGGYRGSPDDAAADVATYVDTPVAGGAGAVDIWTWRQPYDGATVSLLDERLRPNPLWDLLRDRAATVGLITHMTPSAMPTDATALEGEVDLASTVFDAVFVAAGTG